MVSAATPAEPKPPGLSSTRSGRRRNSGAFDLDLNRRLALREALDKANGRIANGVDPAHGQRGMASTAVAAIVAGGTVQWVSVGDSHLYLLRGGKLTKLNEDHSQAGIMLRSGQFQPNDPEVLAAKSVLVSALTGRNLDIVDHPKQALPLQSGDLLVLASDGLNTLDEPEIEALLAQSTGQDARQISARLLDTVRERRADRQDNTAVVVARITGLAVPIAAEPRTEIASGHDPFTAPTELVTRRAPQSATAEPELTANQEAATPPPPAAAPRLTNPPPLPAVPASPEVAVGVPASPPLNAAPIAVPVVAPNAAYPPPTPQKPAAVVPAIDPTTGPQGPTVARAPDRPTPRVVQPEATPRPKVATPPQPGVKPGRSSLALFPILLVLLAIAAAAAGVFWTWRETPASERAGEATARPTTAPTQVQPSAPVQTSAPPQVLPPLPLSPAPAQPQPQSSPPLISGPVPATRTPGAADQPPVELPRRP